MLALSVAAALVGARAANVSTTGSEILYVYPLVVVFFLYVRGMYRSRLRIVILDGITPVVGAISLAAMSVIAVDAFLDPQAEPAPLVARAWVFSLLYVGAGRILLAVSQRRARERGPAHQAGR